MTTSPTEQLTRNGSPAAEAAGAPRGGRPTDAPREVLVVANPRAGRRRGAAVADVVARAAHSFGMAALVEHTRHPGHAAQIAHEYLRRGIRDIVAIGGDGTFGEVASGIVWAHEAGEVGARGAADTVTLGVVHAGTGGDLCRMLAIPRDPDAAAATALCGTLRGLDLGVARFEQDGSTRGFFNVANVGMSADVVKRADGRVRWLGGKGAFAAASVAALARVKPTQLTLDFGDGPLDAAVTDVLVCNGEFVGGGMHAAPLAALDDGILDIAVIGAANPLTLLRKFPKIYRGTHIDDEICRYERRASVRIESAEAATVILDGEPAGTTPVDVSLVSGLVRVRAGAGHGLR